MCRKEGWAFVANRAGGFGALAVCIEIGHLNIQQKKYIRQKKY